MLKGHSRREQPGLLGLLRRILRIETLTLVVTVFELVGIPLAIWALLATLEQTQLSKEALRDQQVGNAWQILSIEGGGMTGKAYALSSLASLGQYIVDVHFDCVERHETYDFCVSKAQLQDADFRGSRAIQTSTFEDAILHGSKFNAVPIVFVSFKNAAMRFSDFRDSRLQRVDFTNAMLFEATFRRASMEDVNFSNTLIYDVDFREITFPRKTGHQINISGAMICSPLTGCNPTIQQEFLSQAYFDESNPPKGLHMLDPELLVHLRL